MQKQPRVLLINPWIEDFVAYDFWLQPVGLLKIGGLLRELGFHVHYIDCLDRWTPEIRTLIKHQKGRDQGDGRGSYYKTFLTKPAAVDFVPRHYARYGLPAELLVQRLAQIPEPDLVCLTSGMTYWYTGIDSVLNIIHDLWPEVPVVLGGLYVNLLADHASHRFQCRRAFPGTGLGPFLDYVCETFELPFQTKNILAGPLMDPLRPAYSLLADTSFLAVETSRGCPFHCDYCASRFHLPNFNQFPLDLIMGQFSYFERVLHTRHIAFYDDALFYNPDKHIKPLLRAVLEAGLLFTFHTPNGLFPRFLDRELAMLMFATHFKTIRLSLDTMSIARHKSMGKLQPHDLAVAFENLEIAGYKRSQLEVYLLTGLPDQTEKDIEEGIQFVAELGGISKLAQYSPIPGTRDWETLVRNGVLGVDSDPLLHNPTVFIYYNPRISVRSFEQLKLYSLEMNKGVVP